MPKAREQPSVEEFFDSLGHGHPSMISLDKFNKLIAVYELSWGNIPSVFDEVEGESVKYCPVTGEELRRIRAYVNNIKTKRIEDVEMFEQIEELREMNTFKTIVTEHTHDLLASLPRAQSECLIELIRSLIQYNQGHVKTDKAKRFKSAVKVLEDMGVVIQVKNGIKRHAHYSYRLAPYLAYKGSESMQESAIHSWMKERARISAERIRTKTGHSFPKESSIF